MRVTFVTGVSCAGKTTIGKLLSAYDDIVVRDIDDNAPARPNIAHLDWLRWRAAEELHRATEWHEDAGIDVDHVVVTGIAWPLRLVESPAWRPAMKAGVEVQFVMLDPRWPVLRERLRGRGAGKALRAYNRELRKVLRTQVDAVRGGWVFDPGSLSAETTAATVATWARGGPRPEVST